MNDPTILGGLQQTDGARAMAVRAIGLMREIFPICRSITGNGVRRTLDLLAREAPPGYWSMSIAPVAMRRRRVTE